MTRTTTQTFLNKAGSINIERAMRAGHEARSDGLRDMLATVVRMIRATSRKVYQ
ncbi:MAG: hypothetical protein ACU0DI_04560 [Paracoccaceae bacterium]